MKKPNLEKLNIQLKQMLPQYCGISFLPFDTTIDVQLKPAAKEKGYSAIATVPMGDITNAVIILFGPQDGTGAYTDTYPKGSLNIPQEYQLTKKSHKIIPRPKNLTSELMLPLGTIINNIIFPNIISLKQLGVNKKTKDVFLEYQHGYETLDDTLLKMINERNRNHNNLFPRTQDIRTTLWTNSLTRKKQGDPHAIYNATNYWQLACFIGFKNKFPTHSHSIDCIIKKPTLILN